MKNTFKKLRRKAGAFTPPLIFVGSFLLSFSIIKNDIIWGVDPFDFLFISSNCIFLHLGKVSETFFATSGLFLFPPGFLFLSCDGISLRVMQSASLSLGILFVYLFARKFYDNEVALISSLFLFTLPFYILQSWADRPFNALFSTFSLLFVYPFLKSDDKKYFFAVSLILGLSASFKVVFIYFYLSLLISLSFLKKYSNNYNFSFSKIDIIKGLLLFLVGFSPFILANFSYGFPSIQFYQKNLVLTGGGHQNFAIVENLATRTNQLFSSFTSNSLLLLPIEIALILYVIFKRDNKDLYLGLICFSFLFFSTFVPSSLSPSHLIPIVPIFAVLLARGVKKMNKPLKIFLIVLFIFIYLQSIYRVNERMSKKEILIEEYPQIRKFGTIDTGTLRTIERTPISKKYQEKRFSSLLEGGIVLFPKGLSEGGCDDFFLSSKCEMRKILDLTIENKSTRYIFPAGSVNSFKSFKEEIKERGYKPKLKSTVESKNKILFRTYIVQ